MNILLLSSMSRNFPADIVPEFKKAGHNIERLNSLEDFLCCPQRYFPYLAIFEIGSKEDYERAYITYDWLERVQPTAPARFLLLIGSKNLEIREKINRFASAEVAFLPSPMKNLLFKAELQARLLKQKQVNPEGYVLSSEPQDLREDRVMVFRGPNPERGTWKPGDLTPSGKIRWRWLNFDEKKLENGQQKLTWEAESQSPPVFKPDRQKWLVEEDEEADLKCLVAEKEVFSAKKAKKILQEKMEEVREKNPPLPGEAEITKKIEDKKIDEPTAVKIANKPNPEVEKKEHTEKKQKESPSPETQAPVNLSSKNIKVDQVFDRALITPTSHREVGNISARKSENSEETEEKKETPQQLDTKALPKEKNNEPVLESISSKKSAPEPAAPVEIKEREKSNFPSNDTPVNIALKNTNVVSSLQSSLNKDILQSKEVVPVNIKEKQWNHVESEGIQPLPAALDEETRNHDQQAITTGSDKSAKKIDVTQENEITKELKPTENFTRAEKVGGEVEDFKERAQKVMAKKVDDVSAKDESNVSEEMSAKKEKLLGAKEVSAAPEKSEDSNNTSNSSISGDWQPIDTQTTGIDKIKLEERKVRGGPSEKERKQIVSGKKEGEEGGYSDVVLSRYQILMTLEELNDNESSWHPVDQYRVYLSARHRYYGVKEITELFPLWIYVGELAPEYLESKKSWRFYDRAPNCYQSLEVLPLPVFEYFSQYESVREFVKEKKLNLQKASGSQKSTADSEELEKEKPQKRKRGFWGFLKKLFGFGN